VRAHAELLDATTVPIPNPRTGGGGEPQGRYNHTYAGATVPGKLGHRWRLPYPYTNGNNYNISGNKFDGQSLLSCEDLCDNDHLCLGLFFATKGCYTLHKLIKCNTSLHGDSYTRNLTAPSHGKHPNGPPPAAVSLEEEVRAKVRLASNLSVAAIHIVDWRHAMPAVWSSGVLPATVFGPFTLNISNAILSTPPDGDQLPAASLVQQQPCGGLHFTLHQLDQPSKQVEGVCDVVAGVTMLALPSPVPWGLVEVRRATGILE
jgi:hypothetical protein